MPIFADLAQRFRARAEQVLAVEGGATRHASAPGQADDRLGRDRLARARLPDDAQRASSFHGERHATDGAHDAVRGVEGHVQVLDVEQ
jgi:hypothetical protein